MTVALSAIDFRIMEADQSQIETSLRPMELLDRLQAIEQGHGRVKLIDKGPRNIDLDIAIFRNEVVDSERLTIPHMLMHEREFVLRPIMEYVLMESSLCVIHMLMESAVFKA
jgi:7,8-dihydro-6-hydroxymethylpterin-pyrophosphokinase